MRTIKDTMQIDGSPITDQELDRISGGIGFLQMHNGKEPTADSDHKKWIDVLSIDWGSHKPGGGATG